MRLFIAPFVFALAGLTTCATKTQGGPDASAEGPAPPVARTKVIPAPRSLEPRGGVLALAPTARVVVSDASLLPHASVLATELAALFGVTINAEQGAPRAGDVSLVLDPSLGDEAHVVDVGTIAVVRGRDLHAVALGTATLLQATQGTAFTRLHVEDAPLTSWRAIMLDLGVEFHPVETLRPIVELARLYKIRYVHLHLTDDAIFSFPSEAFPELATPSASYSRAELVDLEAFARDRGVTIVPEIDMPSHSSAMTDARPDLFDCDPPVHKICPAREDVYGTLSKLLDEVVAIFPSSPYLHIGTDEIDPTWWDTCASCQAFMQQHGIPDGDDLIRYFIARMDGVVRAKGRETLIWEMFKPTGTVPVPKTVTVMMFENTYATATDLVAQGYSVINTAWNPLYVVGTQNQGGGRSWPLDVLYAWNQRRWYHLEDPGGRNIPDLTLDATPALRGAELCAWEQTPEVELSSLRDRAAAVSERLWSREDARSFEEFSIALAHVNPILDKLVGKL